MSGHPAFAEEINNFIKKIKSEATSKCIEVSYRKNKFVIIWPLLHTLDTLVWYINRTSQHIIIKKAKWKSATLDLCVCCS